MLLRYWKYILALVLVVAAFGGGYYSHKPQDVIKIQDKIVEKIVTVETEAKQKTQRNDKVTTIVTKKDGSITKTIVDHTVKTENEQKTKQETLAKEETKTETIKTTPPSAQPQWSLGVDWTPRLDPQFYYPTGVELGRRVLGPVWASGAFDWHQHAAHLGLRVEF